MHKLTSLVLVFLLFSQVLFAHNENTMRQNLYKCQIADVWNKYETEEDIEIKKQMIEKLKQNINNHNFVTPVTQLRGQQEEIITLLINTTDKLEKEILKQDTDLQQQQFLEHQLQAYIFSYLEFEKTISDFKSEQLWKITRIILFVLVLFIFSTIFLTFNYNNAKQRVKRQKGFNNKILQVQEEERKRLSRELHDTVTQDIRTSLLYVRNLKEKQGETHTEEKELIEKIENLETQNLVNIRNIIQNLTPPEIETSSLQNLLAEYCNNISQMTKIKCTFYAEKGIPFEKFNSFQKLNIFRIIQESVTNAIKHADASEINIIVRKESVNSSSLIFFISDDGHGFAENSLSQKNNDITNQSTHLGLQGMKTRAQLLNAKLDIFTDEECGTEIRIVVPLKMRYLVTTKFLQV